VPAYHPHQAPADAGPLGEQVGEATPPEQGRGRDAAADGSSALGGSAENSAGGAAAAGFAGANAAGGAAAAGFAGAGALGGAVAPGRTHPEAVVAGASGGARSTQRRVGAPDLYDDTRSEVSSVASWGFTRDGRALPGKQYVPIDPVAAPRAAPSSQPQQQVQPRTRAPDAAFGLHGTRFARCRARRGAHGAGAAAQNGGRPAMYIHGSRPPPECVDPAS